jgi:hypothetical protein
VFSDPEDANIPAVAGILGALVAAACSGLWPSARALPCLVASFAAGLLLLSATASNLPSFNLWLIPLTSLAGGTSVAASLSHRKE